MLSCRTPRGHKSMAVGFFKIMVCTAKYTNPRAIHTAPRSLLRGPSRLERQRAGARSVVEREKSDDHEQGKGRDLQGQHAEIHARSEMDTPQVHRGIEAHESEDPHPFWDPRQKRPQRHGTDDIEEC